MTLAARGTVYLGGLRFTTDPQTYAPLTWRKRQSVHPGLDGAMTIQDFGVHAKDNTVRLASGSAGYLERSLVVSLHALYRTKGATYTLTDWAGNEFTVFIRDFQADPTFIGTLWTYTMELHVLAIAKLFGVTYSGS